ncbi:unnamed protein product [Mucor circinelloides]
MKAIKRERTPGDQKTIDRKANIENLAPKRMTRRSTSLLRDKDTLDSSSLSVHRAKQGRIQKSSSKSGFTRSSRTSRKAQTQHDGEHVVVKKEEVEKPKISFQSFWYYRYKCCICSDLLSDNDVYIAHLKSRHDVLPFWIRGIKHFGLIPDINDADNYCAACETEHPNNEGYREHLLCVHHMVLSLSDTEFVQAKIETDASRSTSYPDPRDPSSRCKLCDVSFENKFKYRDHLRNVHKMKVVAVKNRSHHPNPNIEPDWYDRNAYCRSCNFTYSTMNIFHAHCKGIHNMKPPVRKSKLGQPDLEDPNHYCKICDITKSDRGMYRQHCREVHGMTTRPIHAGPNFNPNATPNLDDENNYCISCDKTFADRAQFRQHLRHVHKTRTLPPLRKMKDIEPIFNDPNHYCRSCEQKLSSRNAYEQHLQNVHGIDLPVPIYRMPDVMPDIDDPNFSCRACDKTFPNKAGYRNHLKGVHKMRLKSLLRKICKTTKKSLKFHRVHCREVHNMTLSPLLKVCPYPDAVIDENDPNFHCAKCDKDYRQRPSFLKHLRTVHKMQPLTRYAIRYPEKEVDVHHPDRFCAKCDKTLSSSTTFRVHLEKRHNIIVPSEELTETAKSSPVQKA